MKTSRSNKQQSLFANTEQFKCACGCGQIGFRNSRGRKRLYINDTHKKRVTRRKQSDRQPQWRTVLSAKGMRVAAHLRKLAEGEAWENLNNDAQHALYLLSQHPRGFEAGLASVIALLPKSTGYIDVERIDDNRGLDDNVHE